MYSATGTISVFPGPVIVMLPVYRKSFKPVVSIDTVRVAGVVPLAGFTESQFPPKSVAAVTVKAAEVPLLETWRGGKSGGANAYPGGSTAITGTAFETRVTFTTAGSTVGSVAVSVMVPEYVPALSADEFTLTFSSELGSQFGVGIERQAIPCKWSSDSQLPPEPVATEALKSSESRLAKTTKL
jgi:hypothetical protein